MSRAVMIAATGSGAGKTTVTLGLLRALRRQGVDVRGAKSGPDYIDPRFHEAATGAPCFNLDRWAMADTRLRDLAQSGEVLVVEGAMGLFDGVPPLGAGSAAELAKTLNIPVILVVDASHMAQSVAAVVRGFVGHDPQVRIAGVILNRVGSERHARILRTALEAADLPPVLGVLGREAGLSHPSRHLGLVQAGERADLEAFLDHAADLVAAGVDLDAVADLAAPVTGAQHGSIAPPAQRIAIAQDAAFGFCYPHLVQDWRRAGAEVRYFSPLADEAPWADAGFVYLPGGYPELHAGQIAAAQEFINGVKIAAQKSDIYGECGGYMVLGQGLIDADGTRHQMCGLLGLQTSFQQRKLHLGYRQAQALGGPFAGQYRAHEFHYATTLKAEGTPLFSVQDGEGAVLPDAGLRTDRVAGSFLHVIDRVQ